MAGKIATITESIQTKVITWLIAGRGVIPDIR
jgi:hypothetical protein